KMEQGCVPIEEYENVRNSIIHDLREICDPKTGEKIKIKVFKSEELYNGAFLKNAPDIVFLMENGTVEIDAKLGFRNIFEKGNP
ncbi:MAG: hypothetical protein GWN64_03405, partial [Candidatus Thorarchaeota archaeon]|nr:hypothetical protein [Candidatus Thorarchaeota archaeon]